LRENNSETIPLNIYACVLGGNLLNTYNCKGCEKLIGPVETVKVPKNVLASGKEIDYINKHSKNGSVSKTLECNNRK